MALLGFDLSNWQDDSAVDGAPNFVILKATEGTNWVDPSCDRKYQRAKAQGKLVGVYHYADMVDPIAEADAFVDATTGYWQAREAILVLDFETNTNVAWALTWLNRVTSRTGVKPLLYISASTIKAVNWQPVVDADYGLYVAGYPSKYNVTNPAWTDGSDFPYDISPWNFAVIWQYTSSNGSLDRDIAFMTTDGWKAYAGYKQPAPAPTPAPTPAPVITTQDTTATKVIPYTSITTNDDTKDLGYSEVTTKGVDGIETIVTRTTYTDGKVTGSQVISDTVTKEPIAQVTTVGTKQPEPIVTPPAPTPTPTPKPTGNSFILVIGSIVKLITDLFNSFKKK